MMTKVNPTATTKPRSRFGDRTDVIYVRKFFFDVIAYINVRNFLFRLFMLGLVYYVGIGMLRNESRGLTKTCHSTIFCACGKKYKVMKSRHIYWGIT